MTTKRVDRAIVAPRLEAPPERQDDVARIVLRRAGDEVPVHQPMPREGADLDEADREIERGGSAGNEGSVRSGRSMACDRPPHADGRPAARQYPSPSR